MKQFHVYEDWTLEGTPRCFYVGKGDDDRIVRSKRNAQHSQIVKELGFDRRIVLTTESETLTFDEERRLIIERHTHPGDPEYNGIGCNMTLGGQGNSGRIVSTETRTKISAAKKGKTPNKVWTQEERDATSHRMSLLHKGKTISEEHKEALRQRMADPDIKCAMIEKVTQSIRKKYATDEIFRETIKATRVRGEKCKTSKLSTEIVQNIRCEWSALNYQRQSDTRPGITKSFCEKWAQALNVTTVAIYGVIMRRTWKHVI